LPKKDNLVNREVFVYARSLLAERQEQLQALEQAPVSRSDYLTCRNSLKQAINELEVLLKLES